MDKTEKIGRSFGVNMARKGRHTKSITQVVMTTEYPQTSYFTRYHSILIGNGYS